ncbi:hypothetical protein GUB10_04325 [Salegentibacter sp. BLCTC]|uniref:sensor histidine kinase n=1 Tax=Salegentibacter sp. BLCTC TaxID=2697368 RepID=UPI00187B6FF0|nr:histidine kinase [Salegentibacter sp. BLCTC]MBE7639554.1 hypothetical protein [Salegentibacter sp. BLCTC]
MKKILFLIIFLSCWSNCFSQTHFNLTEKEKDTAWEFIRQRFFPQGFVDLYKPGKFYSDIKYHVKNGSRQDILFLKAIIKNIDSLIPNNVSYTIQSENANFIIEIVNPADQEYWPFQNTNSEFRNTNPNSITKQKYWLPLPDNTPVRKREEILRYVSITGLTDISDRLDHIYIHSNFLQQQKSIFYPRKYKVELSENYPEFESIDKFYLSKLYDADLNKQLGTYVQNKYGFWFWLNFNFSGDVLFIIKTSSLLFLFFLIMSIAYRPILIRKYKYKVVSYLANGAFLTNLTLLLLLLVSFFYIYPKDQLYRGTFAESLLSIDLFIFVLIINTAALLFSSLLFLMDYYFLKRNQNLIHQFLIRTTNFLILNFIGTFILYKIANSSDIITVILPFIFLAIARSTFLYFKDRNETIIREKDVQLSQLTASKAQAEVASLHARINPHFLYNSLNSIAGLAHIDADKTEKMALSLSDLFRHNLNRKDEAYSSILEELEAIEAYLEIEQIRFGERLQFSIEVDETLNELQIPRNIIQPLIENAVKHGISAVEGQGVIKLKIIQNQDTVEISVYDNGPAFPEGIVSGYGLQSIFDILELSYQNKAALSWESTPKKRIWISIAKNELKKGQDAI